MSGAVTLPPYPEYQSVDETWFDRIPVHWKATALRGVLNQRNEKNNPIKTTQILSLSIAHGVTLYSDRGRGGNKRKGDLSAYKIAHEGDIVLNSMNVIVGAVGLSRYTGAISPVYYALYPNTIEASITYYDKVFSNPVFQRYLMIYGRGILIKKSDSGKFNTIRMKISPNDLKGTLLPLPPRTEQEQIVAYMRAQDAHIARFIKAKRDLIKLLTEQKLRIIDHAVTRGVDATVTLKASGIEWLGEVPEHWEVVHIGSAVQIINGYPFDSGLFDAVVGHPLVRIRDLNRTHTEVQFNGPEVLEAVINTGDLIVGMDGDFNAARWRGGRALLNQRMCCLRPRKQITTEYLALVIPKALKFINDLTLSTTVKHLSSGDVKRLRFPIPGESEQLQIVAHVENETAPINNAIARTEEEIKLIREYRDRLIADVVTGQLDVRGWQPGPDDVVDDAALAVLGDDQEDVTGEEDGDGEEN